MILTGRHGNVEMRGIIDAWPGWAAAPPSVPPPGWSSGLKVSREAALGVPAAGRAIRIASEAVACLDFDVFVGDDEQRREVTSTWQARFFDEGGAPNPDESWFDVWAQTEASLTAENNAYWMKAKDTMGRVVAVRVLDPATVIVRRVGGVKVFDLMLSPSQKSTLDESSILHFRGQGKPGALAAPNPIDAYVDALGAAVARQRFETGFYERGAGPSIAVSFPENMRPSDVAEYKRQFQMEHGGLVNQHKMRVFGGGATAQVIGLSPRDAQFIEAQNFTVEDVARIYGVPVSMLDTGMARGNSTPLSPEHEQQRWLTYGLEPRLRRIEGAVRRDPDFFGPASRAYPMFVTTGVVRGDLATEDLIAHQQIQDGRLTVNEWRADRGKEPLPGGDIPQIVPVGGAPNPTMPQMPAAPAPAAA